MSVDITIQETIREVDITVNQNMINVNVTRTSGGGGIQSVVAGTNVTVDNTDPNNPIVSATGGGTTPNLPQVLERGDRPYKAIPINYTFQLEDITKWIYASEGGVNTLDDTDDLFLVGCSIPIVVDIQTFEFKAVGTVVYSNLLPNDTPLDSGSLFLYKGDSAELKKISSGAWWLQVTRFNETRYRQAFIRVIPDAGADPQVVNLAVAGDFPDGEFTTTWDTISHFYLNSQSGLFIDEKTIFPPSILFSDGGVYSGAYSITRVDNNILEFYYSDYNGDPLPLVNTQLTIIINN